MRIFLEKNKQKELIELAKGNLTWRELAKKTNYSECYLVNELRKEKVSLSEKTYLMLCKLANLNFDKSIIRRLEDNWGRSKGGQNSSGSLIRLPEVKFDESLAEFVGAVLGDGHVEFYQPNKKVGVYHIRIAGDTVKDKDYHLNYLRPLCKNLFNLEARELLKIIAGNSGRYLDISSKELVKLFISMGLKSGDKIKNQSTIPDWIFDNNDYLRACVRGLIDTDGCIAQMSKRDSKLLRILFTNHNFTLLNDTRKAFVKLGFNPSKLMNNRQFYLSRQVERERYIKESGFSNQKHQNRYIKFRAPSSSGQG